MIPKEIKYTCIMMTYGETFYGRHTAQHQIQYSEIKVKKDCLWKQRTHKITKNGNSMNHFRLYRTKTKQQQIGRFPVVQTLLLLMKSLNKTETPIFKFVLCSLFPKQSF